MVIFYSFKTLLEIMKLLLEITGLSIALCLISICCSVVHVINFASISLTLFVIEPILKAMQFIRFVFKRGFYEPALHLMNLAASVLSLRGNGESRQEENMRMESLDNQSTKIPTDSSMKIPDKFLLLKVSNFLLKLLH